MNILLAGCNGRMGRRVIDCANEKYNVIAGIDNCEKQLDLKTNNEIVCRYKSFADIENYLIEKVDVVLDFALPNILKNELAFCIKNKKPLVICSTGHTDKELELINAASKVIPIFKTTNTSLGVALINKIIRENISAISSYDLCVLEKHHKNKKDAPSGTAKTILTNLIKCGNVDNLWVRGGSVVGEHEIMMFGEYEQISIKHVAENRDLFAKSALQICEFLSGQKENGLYSMEDLLK